MGALMKVKLPRRADVACTVASVDANDDEHVSADNSLFLNTDADCRRPCSSSNRGGLIAPRFARCAYEIARQRPVAYFTSHESKAGKHTRSSGAGGAATMQEEDRRVRAHSDHTGRPVRGTQIAVAAHTLTLLAQYFSINYKLSLSGRDLLAQALAETEPYDDPDAVKTPSLGHRRMSESELSNTYGVAIQSLVEESPGTPKMASARLRKGADPISPSAVPPVPATLLASSEPRRTKSLSTMSETELGRSAPAIPVSRLASNAESLQGFVTCLNSRNVSKYKVGQKYRDGVIVGIDDEHGKLVVYNANMPRGTLIVVKTKDASRYDRGYVVDDSLGKPLGSVHARDTVANILVVNTTLTT